METREEEIRQAWAEERRKRVGTGEMVHFDSFLLGAFYADEHPKSPWVSVEERLPERITEVICKTLGGSKYLCFWDGCRWCSCHHDLIAGATITHWMPIPELPKGGKK